MGRRRRIRGGSWDVGIWGLGLEGATEVAASYAQLEQVGVAREADLS